MPLFDLKQCHVRCQNLIGSYASTHSTFNHIGLETKIRTYKATKATKIHTGRLSTENGSAVDHMIVKWRSLLQDIIAKKYNQHRGLRSRRPLLVTVKTLPNTKSNKREI